MRHERRATVEREFDRKIVIDCYLQEVQRVMRYSE